MEEQPEEIVMIRNDLKPQQLATEASKKIIECFEQVGFKKPFQIHWINHETWRILAIHPEGPGVDIDNTPSIVDRHNGAANLLSRSPHIDLIAFYILEESNSKVGNLLYSAFFFKPVSPDPSYSVLIGNLLLTVKKEWKCIYCDKNFPWDQLESHSC